MNGAYRISGAHEAVDINGQGGRTLNGLVGVGFLLACHGDECVVFVWWVLWLRVVVVGWLVIIVVMGDLVVLLMEGFSG